MRTCPRALTAAFALTLAACAAGSSGGRSGITANVIGPSASGRGTSRVRS